MYLPVTASEILRIEVGRAIAVLIHHASLTLLLIPKLVFSPYVLASK